MSKTCPRALFFRNPSGQASGAVQLSQLETSPPSKSSSTKDKLVLFHTVSHIFLSIFKLPKSERHLELLSSVHKTERAWRGLLDQGAACVQHKVAVGQSSRAVRDDSLIPSTRGHGCTNLRAALTCSTLRQVEQVVLDSHQINMYHNSNMCLSLNAFWRTCLNEAK